MGQWGTPILWSDPIGGPYFKGVFGFEISKVPPPGAPPQKGGTPPNGETPPKPPQNEGPPQIPLWERKGHHTEISPLRDPPRLQGGLQL